MLRCPCGWQAREEAAAAAVLLEKAEAATRELGRQLAELKAVDDAEVRVGVDSGFQGSRGKGGGRVRTCPLK
jgi:hypothetical protein